MNLSSVLFVLYSKAIQSNLYLSAVDNLKDYNEFRKTLIIND